MGACRFGFRHGRLRHVIDVRASGPRCRDLCDALSNMPAGSSAEGIQNVVCEIGRGSANAVAMIDGALARSA
jgi:hypothetical protein